MRKHLAILLGLAFMAATMPSMATSEDAAKGKGKGKGKITEAGKKGAKDQKQTGGKKAADKGPAQAKQR